MDSEKICDPELIRLILFGAFIVLTMISAAAVYLVILIAKRRNKELVLRIQAVDNERSRIASDVHDDLGGGFTSIRALSKRALKHAESEEQISRIQRLASVAETTAVRLREVIWAMDSRNDTSERLGVHIRRQSVDFLEQHDMKVDVVMEQIGQTTIRAEKRRAVALVVKEALHNAVKYSDARSIKLQIRGKERFEVVIEEIGGQGFDVEEAIAKDGHGVYNMQKRISDVAGQISFEKTSEGFTTSISVPFDQTL